MKMILNITFLLLYFVNVSFGLSSNYDNFMNNMTLKHLTTSNIEPSFITDYVTMRDGVKLAIDYFLPTFTTKYPCIVEITPYGRILGRPNFRNEAAYWLEHGFAFVIADARGTGDSQGDFIFFIREGQDGYDLVEWIAKQPWSNGRVGMRGASYSGENQWYTARENPPHLSCITPSATAASPFHEVPYKNGAFVLNWALYWIGSSVDIPRTPAADPHPDPSAWLKHRPLRTLDKYALGRELALYRTFLDHPTYDEFWSTLRFNSTDFARINIPTLAFTGWFDSTLTGTIEDYQDISRFSDRHSDHFLIIGPYTHATAPDGGYDFLTGEPVSNVGDIAVPENGLLPARDMTRQFYEWCLKDKPKPEWKPVTIFVTGSNKWITPDVSLLANVYETSFFLTSGGNANGIKGDGHLQLNSPENISSDHYIYDPNSPLFIDMSRTSYEYPVDINSILNRNDVLVYTSDELNHPLTVIGNITIELSFSTTVKDTDLIIQLMDVLPDGRSIKLGSGFGTPLRLRYRDGFKSEILMTPGQMYSINIRFPEIGHTFLPKHRMRLSITSSFFPWINANSNTGDPIATDTGMPIIANHTIHYIPTQPSRIRMLVIDNLFMEDI